MEQGMMRDQTARLNPVGRKKESSFIRAGGLVCVIGFDAYFKQLNAVWEIALGASLEELKAVPFTERIHPEDLGAAVEAVRSLTLGEPKAVFECRFRKGDGGYRHFIWTAKAFHEEQLFYASVQDVTDRRDSQAEATDFFQKLSSLTSDALVIHERGMIVETNASFADLLGYSRDELIGRTVLDLTTPEWRHLIMKKWMTRDKNPYVIQARRKNGSTFPIKVTSLRCHYEGKPVRLAIIKPLPT
jgi:PAS domain S-box-containing protein